MTSPKPIVQSRRASSPSHVLHHAWQALQSHGCILCRQPGTVCGVYLPGPTAPSGLPAGKSLAYLLCAACYALPKATVTARVEAWVAADLRRQQASRPEQSPLPDRLPPDELGWAVICRVLQVPAAIEKRVWKVLTRWPGSTVQTLRFNLARLSENPSHAMAQTLLVGPLEPRAFVALIEALVKAKKLQRSDATFLEERIFENMGAEHWR